MNNEIATRSLTDGQKSVLGQMQQKVASGQELNSNDLTSIKNHLGDDFMSKVRLGGTKKPKPKSGSGFDLGM